MWNRFIIRETSQAGAQVTGVDLSADMLAVAEEQGTGSYLCQLTFVEQPMQQLTGFTVMM